jgi:hypothetical protein
MQALCRRSWRSPLVAALLLLALAASTVGSFVHTDDGCVVERHCKACRVALASAGAAPPEVPQLPASAEAGLVSPEAAATERDVPVASAPSRGPPAAL